MNNIFIATRRELLGHGLGVVGVGAGLGATLPSYLVRTALAGPDAEQDQRVLVVVQLNGGNDAMSMLVPYGHEEYAKVRNVTRIKDEEVIKLNNEVGLHPNLKGFKQMLDQGAFAAIPGIGYPQPNLSHFHSQDIWHTGDPRGRQVPIGWIGRAIDVGCKGSADPALAIAVGTGSTPIVVQGVEHTGRRRNEHAHLFHLPSHRLRHPRQPAPASRPLSARGSGRSLKKSIGQAFAGPSMTKLHSRG